MIEEKYLPVGTVVMLKNGSKRAMICGFCPISEGKTYDYVGCLYPEGQISPDKSLLFNHDQIEKIYFKGFVDEEEKQFKEQLKIALQKIHDKKPEVYEKVAENINID